MAKFLRNKVDGTVYDWNPILAKNPKCEEVSEQEAFPERFIPKKQKGRKSSLNLTTDDIPEAPEYTHPDLAEEAAKGFPQ